MAEDVELERQLAELSARIDSLELALTAFQAAHPAGSTAPPAAKQYPAPPISGAPGGKTIERLESRIGSQLLNRVGIFAVLFAAAWFLKLAFDRNWIGPGVRILFGLAAAAALIAWSERFRIRGFAAFSYTLKALGTGIAYLALWAASSVYHLLPSAVAFPAMAAVTLANALLAWRQDSEVLALYALAGGLATPALLSSGGWREGFLFSYLLLLDLGALFSLALRPWKRLAAASFVGTGFYFALWAIRFYDPSRFSISVFFAAAFFVIFAAAPFLLDRTGDAERLSGPSRLFLCALPIANGVVCFAEVMSLFEGAGHSPSRSWAVFALASAFLLLAAMGRRPSLLSNVHLSLAVLFVTVAIPLEFHGCVVTLCWLGEAFGLIAFARARGHSHSTMRLSGAAVLALAALDVMLLEWAAPPRGPSPVLWNMHFWTYLAAAGIFAGIARLSLGRVESSGEVRRESFLFGSWTYLAAFSTILFSLTVLLAVSVEIHHYWFCGATLFHDFCGLSFESRRAVHASFTLSAWYMLYGAALMTVGFWRSIAFLRWQALLLLGFSIAKVFLRDVSGLSAGYRVLSFLALGVLLLAVSFAYQKTAGRRGAAIR